MNGISENLPIIVGGIATIGGLIVAYKKGLLNVLNMEDFVINKTEMAKTRNEQQRDEADLDRRLKEKDKEVQLKENQRNQREITKLAKDALANRN